MPGKQKPGKEWRLLAFPVYPGVTPLDLVGPLTVLRNLYGTPYRTVVVGERREQLDTDTALRVLPPATFAEVPQPFAVVVPGGGAATVAAMHDQELVGSVRSAAATAELVGATGNGALLLAAAGLLQGPAGGGPPGLRRAAGEPRRRGGARALGRGRPGPHRRRRRGRDRHDAGPARPVEVPLGCPVGAAAGLPDDTARERLITVILTGLRPTR